MDQLDLSYNLLGNVDPEVLKDLFHEIITTVHAFKNRFGFD